MERRANDEAPETQPAATTDQHPKPMMPTVENIGVEETEPAMPTEHITPDGRRPRLETTG